MARSGSETTMPQSRAATRYLPPSATPQPANRLLAKPRHGRLRLPPARGGTRLGFLACCAPDFIARAQSRMGQSCLGRAAGGQDRLVVRGNGTPTKTCPPPPPPGGTPSARTGGRCRAGPAPPCHRHPNPSSISSSVSSTRRGAREGSAANADLSRLRRHGLRAGTRARKRAPLLPRRWPRRRRSASRLCSHRP